MFSTTVYDFRTQYCILEHRDEFYFCSSHSCQLIIIKFDLEMFFYVLFSKHAWVDMSFFSQHLPNVFFNKKLTLYSLILLLSLPYFSVVLFCSPSFSILCFFRVFWILFLNRDVWFTWPANFSYSVFLNNKRNLIYNHYSFVKVKLYRLGDSLIIVASTQDHYILSFFDR